MTPIARIALPGGGFPVRTACRLTVLVAAIMVVAFVGGCAPPPKPEPYVFMGVPEGESGEKGPTGLIGGKAATLSRMSTVMEASYAEYEAARRAGKIVAEEKHGGYVYWATKSWRSVHFDNASAQVEITDRFKARMP
jgi:hypothetical protein